MKSYVTANSNYSSVSQKKQFLIFKGKRGSLFNAIFAIKIEFSVNCIDRILYLYSLKNLKSLICIFAFNLIEFLTISLTMDNALDVYLSNRLEILYQQLKCSLFDLSNKPLMRRIVVVYGPAMKNWLILKMAQDPDLNVAMGIEFVYLSEAFELLLGNSVRIPTLLELSLAIETEIFSLIQKFYSLHPDEQQEWLPVMDHLNLNLSQTRASFRLSRKMERRLIGLSQNLARLFQDYGRYAFRMIEQWEKSEAAGWQPRLWRKLFVENSEWKWRSPVCALQSAPAPSQSFTLNIFSISFMTASEFDYLNRLSEYVPVNYFLLSPCAVFWSDIRSDKESAYLEKYWQKKLGFDSSQVIKLEELLRDRNPLLANFGRIGREMASQIEQSMAQTSAVYALPEKVQVLDEELFMHDDLHLTEEHTPLSLLHALQADLLMMRNPQGSPPIDLEDDHNSIQLHIASCRRREIEILYHNVLGLMLKDHSLCPGEIIVMAPQIEEYSPYIQSIFGHEESQLDFQILDLGLQTQSEIVQGFLQLVELSEGRWDASQLLQLFEHDSFQRRFQISKSDFSKIQEWVEDSGIRWGDDAFHRNELLQRRHCEKGMADETMVGTWDYGISRLLFGLTAIPEKSTSLSLDAPPCSLADFSDSDLLGKWIGILHALRDDLTPFQDRSSLTMDDWVNYLNCLLENYFKPDFENQQSLEEYDELKSQFEILRNASRFIPDASFSYSSVKTHLLSLLKHRSIAYREEHLQAVRFCSLMPLRSIPAKTIVLLGMQEGAFPRSGLLSSLNLMAEEKKADYCPLSNDFDRHLFLEAMHSAQKYLIISYCGYSREENKELKPSLLVEELFSYLDKFYTIQGLKPTQNCVFKHPFDAFDVRYFLREHGLNNFSQRDFKAAQAVCKIDKQNRHAVIADFAYVDHLQASLIPSGTCIDLKYLNLLVRDPIKFHFNRTVEIYLQTEDDRLIKTEEDLTLSNFDKSSLLKLNLKLTMEEVLLQAEREGRLPFGLFKIAAHKEFKRDSEKMHEDLIKHALDSASIFEIVFSGDCIEPSFEKERWLLPAVKLFYEDGTLLSIAGKIPHATSKGLLDLSKGTFADIWKVWPQFLLYCEAAKRFPHQLKAQLISSEASEAKEAFFEDPAPYLKQLIHYYSLCLNNFSPLMPDWIPLILEEDEEKLQDKIRKLFDSSFTTYQNPYLQRIFNKDSLPMTESILLHWKKTAEALSGEIMQNWFDAKRQKKRVK